MRRYKVTAVTAVVTMGLMLVLFGLAGSVLADQNKDPETSQGMPPVAKAATEPVHQTCPCWIEQHPGVIEIDPVFRTQRVIWGPVPNSYCNPSWGSCFHGGTLCYWIIIREGDDVQTQCLGR